MHNYANESELFQAWPSFADIALCTMFIFLVFTILLMILISQHFELEEPEQIAIGELSERELGRFKTGQADLPEGYEHAINTLYLQIVNHKIWRDSTSVVIVEGHTDNIPIKNFKYRNNWELSTARALSVVEYLTEVKGIPTNRIRAIGYGEHMPKFNNDTETSRARNRRIEIRIFKPSKNIRI